MTKGITSMTSEEARALLDRGYETGKYEPRGKFLIKIGLFKYSAIDNGTGDAWMEIFSSKRKAIRWLNGGRAKNTEGLLV